MALEMKVYREIKAYEAKVMFGMSWRQLGAMALGFPLGSGLFAAVTFVLHRNGYTWEHATTVALYPMLILLIPFAAWGWWRPKNLKPEKYVGYVLRHLLTRKVTPYADTYAPEPARRRPAMGPAPAAADASPVGAAHTSDPYSTAGRRGHGHLPAAGASAAPSRAARRKQEREARRSRRFVPSEH